MWPWIVLVLFRSLCHPNGNTQGGQKQNVPQKVNPGLPLFLILIKISHWKHKLQLDTWELHMYHEY